MDRSLTVKLLIAYTKRTLKGIDSRTS